MEECPTGPSIIFLSLYSEDYPMYVEAFYTSVTVKKAIFNEIFILTE